MRLFTDKERRTFEQLCSLKQTSVIQMMRQFLKSKYNNIITTPSYIVAIGNIPVALVAHADTVFKTPPKEFYYDKDKNVMWSPDGLGADDRAGIFAIMKIVALGQLPHVIITTDEESGCIGANKLAAKVKTFPAPLKFMIQLDRRNNKDAVYYDCDNKEFEEFITHFGFETNLGSFTDISILAPAWKVAAVNFSIGYQDEHSHIERLNVDALFDTIDKVQSILHRVETDETVPVYEYIERYYNYTYEQWYEDDGYCLHRGGSYRKLEKDEEKCQFCGEADKRINLLPLHWHAADSTEITFYICNECYATSLREIEWCSKCNKGFFLTREDLNEMPADRTTWVCKHCRQEEKTVDSVG